MDNNNLNMSLSIHQIIAQCIITQIPVRKYVQSSQPNTQVLDNLCNDYLAIIGLAHSYLSIPDLLSTGLQSSWTNSKQKYWNDFFLLHIYTWWHYFLLVDATVHAIQY